MPTRSSQDRPAAIGGSAPAKPRLSASVEPPITFCWRRCGSAQFAMDSSALLLRGGTISVLLVRHLLHPLDNLAVERFRDREVGHCRFRGCAMPVLLARRGSRRCRRTRISSTGLPSRCAPAAPRGDDQRLAERMRVPQAVRAPGSNVTSAPPMRAGSSRWKREATETEPVKYSAGPFGGRASREGSSKFLSSSFRAIWSGEFFAALGDCLGNRHGGDRPRPASVKGEMGDHFGDLSPAEAAIHSPVQVERQLIDLASRDQGRDRDETAIWAPDPDARHRSPNSTRWCIGRAPARSPDLRLQGGPALRFAGLVECHGPAWLCVQLIGADAALVENSLGDRGGRLSLSASLNRTRDG